jgi:hypothetical protein
MAWSSGYPKYSIVSDYCIRPVRMARALETQRMDNRSRSLFYIAQLSIRVPIVLTKGHVICIAA